MNRSSEIDTEDDSYCSDTSTSSAATSRMRTEEELERRRDKIFRKFGDYDIFDTESYQEEVPLIPPFIKKRKYFPILHPWLFETEEEAAYKQAKNAYFGIEEDRSNQLPLETLIVNDWVQNYLGCPITRWKPIRTLSDKVELEPLETDVLPPLKPYTPIIMEINRPDGSIINVQRVIGYREIMEKRAQKKKLRLNMLEKFLRKRRMEKSKSRIKVKPIPKDEGETERRHCRDDAPKESNIDNDMEGIEVGGGGDCVREDEVIDGETAAMKMKYSIEYSWIPSMGGDGDGDAPPLPPPSPTAARFPFASQSIPTRSAAKRKGSGSSSGSASGSPKGPKSQPSSKSKPPKAASKESIGSKGESEPAPAPAPTKVPSTGSIQEDYGAYLRKRDSFVGDEESLGTDSEEDARFQSDGEEVMIRDENEKKSATQRDEEWLLLSSSDSDELILQFDAVLKPKRIWMNKDASFESQQFHKSLWSLRCFLFALGRLSFFDRVDKAMGMVVFSVNYIKEIPFICTSMFLWIIFVLTIHAVIEVLIEDEDKGLHKLDEISLTKQRIALLGIYVYISFAGIWSLGVILHDGMHICQFLNLMAAALTKTEMSANRSITAKFILNLVISSMYIGLYSASFYYDNPMSNRKTHGFLALLVIQPFYPHARVLLRNDMTLLDIAGFILHMFCYLSTRLIFTLMHILAAVIENMAKNWNFRFCLLFAQLGQQQRGQIYRLHNCQSMMKIFSQHRLVASLTRMYGNVFAVPLIFYYTMQIAIVASIVIFEFFLIYASAHRDEDRKTVTVVVPISNNTNITLSEEDNTNYEQNVTSLFVLVHFLFEFIFVSEAITGACNAVLDSFEFIRRHGLLRCANTHERRLLMSLQWSVSSKNPAIINVHNFFTISRATTLASLGFSVVIVSLVIQLKQDKTVTLVLPCVKPGQVYFPNNNTCFEILRVFKNEVQRYVDTRNAELGQPQFDYDWSNLP